MAPTGAATLDTSHVPVGGDWVVVGRAGDAVWRQQGDAIWQNLEAAQVVPAQSEIETGRDGALMLVVGGDRLAWARTAGCRRAHQTRTSVRITRTPMQR